MNRVGAAKIALKAAGKLCSDAVLASDGFFPFADTVELANEYGIKAIVQPGGSLRDQANKVLKKLPKRVLMDKLIE